MEECTANMDEEFKNIDLEKASKDADKLVRFLKYKGEGHTYYKTYSSLERMEKNIYFDKCLYLSNGKDWNDIIDSENFKSDKEYKHFAMCFSTLKSENVAMWMLYGKNARTGAMLDLTKKDMRKLLQIDEISVGKFIDKGYREFKILKKNDFSIWLTDMLYVGKNDDKELSTIKRGNETFGKADNLIIDRVPNFYKKTYAWNYENETRLIVSIPMNVYDELCSDATAVKLNIGNLWENIHNKIRTAPNYDSAEEDIFEKSVLKGQINWDLCKNCSQKERK